MGYISVDCEGHEPEINVPVPTIIDLSIGLITLIYLVLGIRGIIRSERWSSKRKQHHGWRFYLRLIPQLMPVVVLDAFSLSCRHYRIIVLQR